MDSTSFICAFALFASALPPVAADRPLVDIAPLVLATIAIAENLWRNHHRGQAIATLILSNTMMAAVGGHNAMVLRGERP